MASRLSTSTALRLRLPVVLGAALLVGLASLAHADWIETRSGTLIRGEVAFSTGEQTYVRLAGGGLIVLEREEVVAVAPELSLPERLAQIEAELRQERYDRALRHARIARRQHPTLAAVELAYIRTRIARGEEQEALQAARVAGILHPEDMRLRLKLGILLTGAAQFEQAAAVLRELRERLHEMRPRGRRGELPPEIVALRSEVELAWQRLLEQRRVRSGPSERPEHDPAPDPHYDTQRYSDPLAAQLGEQLLDWARGFGPLHANCFTRAELHLSSGTRYRPHRIEEFEQRLQRVHFDVVVNPRDWQKIKPEDGGLSPEEEDRNFRERAIIVHGFLSQLLSRFDRDRVNVRIRVLRQDSRDRHEELWRLEWRPTERGDPLSEEYRLHW